MCVKACDNRIFRKLYPDTQQNFVSFWTLSDMGVYKYLVFCCPSLGFIITQTLHVSLNIRLTKLIESYSNAFTITWLSLLPQSPYNLSLKLANSWVRNPQTRDMFPANPARSAYDLIPNPPSKDWVLEKLCNSIHAGPESWVH